MSASEATSLPPSRVGVECPPPARLEDALRARAECEAQQQRLRALAAALIVAEESERRATATELHDEIGQSLAAVKLKLDSLEQDVVPEAAAAAVRDVSRLVSQIIGRARSLMTELSPPGLYDLGFDMALEWLAKRTTEREGIACRLLRHGTPVEITPELRLLLFAAARELLRNVAHHSGVREAALTLVYAPARVELEIEDAGRGFDTGTLARLPNASRGFGLFAMSERARDLGGSMDIVSAPGRGTRVRLSFPLEYPATIP
jgi:signal transduction histidine kinase